MSVDARPQPFLSGVRVLEVGGGIAGATAAAALAVLGAEVTKVGRADEAPQPRSGPFLSTPSGTRAAVVDLTLDQRKRWAAWSERLLDEVDVVILDGAAFAVEPAAGGPVIVSITPFGLTGPRSGEPGGELVAQAAGGLLGTIEGPDGSPVPAPGYVASKAVGMVAALAALHGLDRRPGHSGPLLVDVSAQEAVVFVAALPECAHLLYECPGRAGSGRYLAPSGVFQCQDGLVRITAVEKHQWRGLLTALDQPQWAQGLDERAARIENADLINRHVTSWAGTFDKADCAALLQANGVPSTPVNTAAELLASPQLAYRGSLEETSLAGVSAHTLGSPWVTENGTSSPRPRSGSLGDLRITELTHVLAGPIVGALLGAMGARVVRLEDPDRLDIYRRTGPFAGGRPGVERGAYFAVANHSKDSALIDPTCAAQDVALALEQSDVLIENVGTPRLRRFGVDPVELAASGRLAVRVSGFGSAGPLAGYRVYANNVQAYGGLAGLTTDRMGRPARLGTVMADPLSSVVAATVIAAWAVGPARAVGAVIDLSMAEVVASTVAEFVAAASADTPADQDDAVHRGVYRSADQRWVAVELLGDADWALAREALGIGRHSELEALSAGIATVAGHDAAKTLAAAGVRAAVVQRAEDLVSDAHLDARGFFPTIAHPDPDIGTARLVGLPWRFHGTGPIRLRPPPALGNTRLHAEATDERNNNAR